MIHPIPIEQFFASTCLDYLVPISITTAILSMHFSLRAKRLMSQPIRSNCLIDKLSLGSLPARWQIAARHHEECHVRDMGSGGRRADRQVIGKVVSCQIYDVRDPDAQSPCHILCNAGK